MPESAAVLVVADDPLARGGIAALLGSTASVTVTGVVAPDEASEAVTSTTADCAIVDLGREPNPQAFLDGLELDIPVLALAGDSEQASAALAGRANGVLSREADAESLVAGLAAIAAGLHVTDPRFAPAPVPRPGVDGADTLTPREHEVLGLVADGLPNKTIALELGLSEHTVKFHLTAVMSKLDAQSRAEAVAEGFRRGLIAL